MSKLTKRQKENLHQLVDHLTKFTFRISKWNEEGKLTGRCSGFLYQPSNLQIPIVITAGHGMPEKGAFIETRIRKDGKTFMMNAGEFKVWYNHEDIDFAFSVLPAHLYREEIEKFSGIDLSCYTHDFIKAKKGDEGYGFAVINNYEFIKDGNGFVLPTYCCHELFLELVEQDEHINYFKLAREFQGHEYYEGASGSPIADQEGAITSILIGGDEKTGLLRAFRLDNIELSLNTCLKAIHL